MGGLGSIVGGLGSVLGGITGPLLNPLLGPVIGGLVDGLGNTYTNKKPAPGTPAPIVVSPGPYGPSVTYQPGSPYGPKFGGPQFGSPNPFPPRPVGESKPAGPAPMITAVPREGSVIGGICGMRFSGKPDTSFISA